MYNHIEHLRILLYHFGEHGIYLNPWKCLFRLIERKLIRYKIFVIGNIFERGIAIDLERSMEILKTISPRKKSEPRFLINFTYNFICSLIVIVTYFNVILKNSQICWSQKVHVAFKLVIAQKFPRSPSRTTLIKCFLSFANSFTSI